MIQTGSIVSALRSAWPRVRARAGRRSPRWGPATAHGVENSRSYVRSFVRSFLYLFDHRSPPRGDRQRLSLKGRSRSLRRWFRDPTGPESRGGNVFEKPSGACRYPLATARLYQPNKSLLGKSAQSCRRASHRLPPDHAYTFSVTLPTALFRGSLCFTNQFYKRSFGIIGSAIISRHRAQSVAGCWLWPAMRVRPSPLIEERNARSGGITSDTRRCVFPRRELRGESYRLRATNARGPSENTRSPPSARDDTPFGSVNSRYRRARDGSCYRQFQTSVNSAIVWEFRVEIFSLFLCVRESRTF